MKNKVLSNFVWRFFEKTGAQLVTFIVSIILARILDPTVYGTVALVTVFTSILNVFVDGGLANALIQKKNADDLDFSSVFYFNICMCVGLYLIMFFLAPFISGFYKNPELVPLIRVLSLIVVVSGVKNVQQAFVSRNFLFKKFFFSTLTGTIFSSIIGVYLAITGAGVWALVAQTLSNMIIDTLILWITVKWRPKLVFSWKRLISLLSYGWKLLISGLIDTVYNQIRQLIIGKIYTPQELAFYNQAEKFPSVVVSNLNISIDSVLFPAMSQAQNDRDRVRDMTRTAIMVSTFVMAPLMMGMAFTANNIVHVVLTDKWIACVPFLRIFCITFMFYPIHTSNLNAIKALGRSDLFLKLEVLKKLIGAIAIATTMFISIEAMALSLLVTSITSQLINSWPNRKLLNYSYLEQLKDILPSIVIAIIMGLIVKMVDFFPIGIALKLFIQIIIGIIVYITLSKCFKLEVFSYLLNILKGRKNNLGDLK